jgi:hypothetical protein
MNWSKINIRDLEKVFNEVFNPETLFGFQAIQYDEALRKSSYYGINWKKEMQNADVYFNFVADYLENEGLTPNDFKEN